ncbi:sugar transferase [Bacillota bacterium Meth-B3]|nr:sugar transferase [Christensenellaceae bacterium]MEA5064607.1 sugar transferase [Eubacteriales bacterium]MEA5067986.1 sugar transferase [Christensenellaceae bacterium]
MYKRFGKRMLDILLSALALVALSPVMAIVALAVKLTSKGPVLFRQKRVGKDKRLFEIYKFRTMYADTPGDTPTHLLKGARAHITRVGGFLRRSSLDELPQLLNILRGDMSVVGPRPALWNQADLIAERDRYEANALTPGLTGLAQVSGRDELPIAAKARLDGEYAAKLSFALDAWCVWRTARKVFQADGVVEGAKDDRPVI